MFVITSINSAIKFPEISNQKRKKVIGQPKSYNKLSEKISVVPEAEKSYRSIHALEISCVDLIIS